jgi:NADPH-dependent ferric siderophore reductase
VVAVSGPGRGFAVDPDVTTWLVVGDETAMAAMAQLLDTIPPTSAVTAHIEAPPGGRIALPSHPGATVVWHDPVAGGAPGDALMAAMTGESLRDDTRVWAAGEAAAMQRLRRHLLDERALPRGRCTVRGYWKVGRSAEGAGDDV